MTPKRDIERVLEHWLDDGIDQMPDRVYLTILDRVERQPQQRAWRVSWRDSHVNSYVKPLLAIAAVVVIAVAGIAILGRPSNSDVGGAVSPAPSPSPESSPSPAVSAAPSVSPSANAVYPAWFTGGTDGAGILPAGSQTTQSFMGGATFTVPEGWVNDVDNPDEYGLFPDTPANEAEYASSRRIAQAIFMTKVDTPWLICEEAGEAKGATAAELADSLAANEAFATSEPVEVTIGGLSGRRIDFQLDPAWTGSCALRPGDPPTMDYKDNRGRGIFLDRPDGGKLLIIVDSLNPAGFEAHLAEAMPIIESLKFDTGQ